ncbi:MAG: DUF402 domain-containing protein [Ktedonobacterales bacterium]
MKRKWAARRAWARITRQRFISERLETVAFRGAVSLYAIDALNTAIGPLWVECAGAHICIADVGHTWLQHFPDDEPYVLTTMFDADGHVSQYYVDICQAHGLGADGIPWYDDLYLDIVKTPGGALGILDADELDVALAVGLITPEQHSFAWAETRRLEPLVNAETLPAMRLAPAHRAFLLARLTTMAHE